MLTLDHNLSCFGGKKLSVPKFLPVAMKVEVVKIGNLKLFTSCLKTFVVINTMKFIFYQFISCFLPVLGG
jgi:hypothetical protein